MNNNSNQHAASDVPLRTLDAAACDAGMARALIASALYGMVAVVLAIVAVKHSMLFIRILAGAGVLVAGVFLAYWVWWYRFFKRMRAQTGP